MILAQGTANTAVVQRESHGIPVVFVNVSDPIGSGFVANLARPSGNVTGFLMYEASITGKWLAMLKEIAPYLTRVALLVGPLTATNHFVEAATAAAPSLAIELVPSRVENAADIERVIESFARVPKGGLLVPPDNTTIAHRDLVIALAARDRLPAVYSLRLFVGGRRPDVLRDRSNRNVSECGVLCRPNLRGAKPTDLPVQAPTKDETTLNLKTAKALGLTVPPALLSPLMR